MNKMVRLKVKIKRRASDISSIVYIFIILFVIIPGLAFFLIIYIFNVFNYF